MTGEGVTSLVRSPLGKHLAEVSATSITAGPLRRCPPWQLHGAKNNQYLASPRGTVISRIRHSRQASCQPRASPRRSSLEFIGEAGHEFGSRSLGAIRIRLRASFPPSTLADREHAREQMLCDASRGPRQRSHPPVAARTHAAAYHHHRAAGRGDRHCAMTSRSLPRQTPSLRPHGDPTDR